MSVAAAAAFALTCLLLIAVPGPSVLFIIGRALDGGFRMASATALGNAAGAATTGAVVTLGLGGVLTTVPTVGIVLRFVGAAVLVLLGLLTITGAARPHPVAGAQGSADRTVRSAFGAAIIIGVTNPKTFIVFGAILPGFVPAGQPWWAPVALAPIPIGIGLITDMLWAVAAARAATWLTRSAKGPRALTIVGGVLLITLGILTGVAF